MNDEEFHVTKGDVFDDLDLEESEELKVRSDLLSEINLIIRASKLQQKKIAVLLGISPPKVSLLMNGKLSAFSTDTLMRYLRLLGRSIEIFVKGKTPLTTRVRAGRFAVVKNRRLASTSLKRRRKGAYRK